MVLIVGTGELLSIRRVWGNRGRTTEGLMILEWGGKGLGFWGCIHLGYRSVLRKQSGPVLTEPLPEVLVLRRAGGEVQGNFQAHRKTSRGRQSCLQAMSVAGWAPAHDGTSGPVNRGIVSLEPRETCGTCGDSTSMNWIVSLWFPDTRRLYGGGMVGDPTYRVPIQHANIYRNGQGLSGDAQLGRQVN
jgi:hypothetical protein